EICQRIETAELETKRLVYGLGFTASEHITIAEKLLSDPPTERFDRLVVDNKVATREGHLHLLQRLVKKVRALDAQVAEQYIAWQKAARPAQREKLAAQFRKLDKKLQATFPKFCYKPKVLDDMIAVADDFHEKFKASVRRFQQLETQPKSRDQQAALHDERTNLRALEQFVRLPHAEFSQTFDQLKRAAERGHHAK